MAPPRYHRNDSSRGRGRGGPRGNKRRREESPPAASGVAAGPSLLASQRDQQQQQQQQMPPPQPVQPARTLGERAMDLGMPCAQCARNVLFAEEAERCVFDPNGICALCQRDGERCDVLETWLWDDVNELRDIKSRVRTSSNTLYLDNEQVFAQVRLRIKMDEDRSSDLIHSEVQEDTHGATNAQLQAMLLTEGRKTNMHLGDLKTSVYTDAYINASLATDVRAGKNAVVKSNQELSGDIARLEGRMEKMQQELHTDNVRLGQRMEACFERLGDRLEAALRGSGSGRGYRH